jgi:hypothetical protein
MVIIIRHRSARSQQRDSEALRVFGPVARDGPHDANHKVERVVRQVLNLVPWASRGTPVQRPAFRRTQHLAIEF